MTPAERALLIAVAKMIVFLPTEGIPGELQRREAVTAALQALEPK